MFANEIVKIEYYLGSLRYVKSVACSRLWQKWLDIMQILLVDDHRMMLAGLRFILQREGLNVIAEATNGREAVKKVGELHPISC